METEMERNETKRNEKETARMRQLISEHFDFALSQLQTQCTKSGEFDNLESDLTHLAKECACHTKDSLHFAGACSYV